MNDYKKYKIIIGSESQELKEKNVTGYSWKFYIKPYKKNNLNFIKNVTVYLHETFENKVRILNKKNNFTINELGWGEFDIKIHIFLKNYDEPIIYEHFLKLFDYEGNKIVVNETVESILVKGDGNSESSDSETRRIEKCMEYVKKMSDKQ